MGYTVDIDVGGTLTDGVVTDAERLECVKVDTTPHDLTVCFFDCLRAAAGRLGFDDLRAFLSQVDVIRWSSTVSSNILAERKGPKLGLFVTRGHETDLYSGEGKSPAIGEIVLPENVVGLLEPDPVTVLSATRQFLSNGVRHICVSLAGSFYEPADERAVKELIRKQYPDHYLGTVPVLLGSDICFHPDDMTRTHRSLIDAYTHGPLAASLFKAEDELWGLGYDRPFLIGHNSGGVATVAKTRAIDTLEAGPAMGLHAAAYWAGKYGLERVVSVDVGGTTSKVGLIGGGRVLRVEGGDWFGIPDRASRPYLRSIALGGGSAVRVENSRLRLGPESMGAFPGPACYDLGGTRATLTDALLILGRLDADFFLGGSRRLNVEAAKKVLAEQVAGPLGLGVTEAAARVVELAEEEVARAVREALAGVGWSPDRTVLFAFGGNGALLAPGVVSRAGLAEAYVFDLGPVFSALGSALTDIVHLYEHVVVDSTPDGLKQVMERLYRAAVIDLRGEQLDTAKASYTVEALLADNRTVTVPLDQLLGEGPSSYRPEGPVRVVRLWVTFPTVRFEPRPGVSGVVGETVPGRRPVFWKGAEAAETPFYRQGRLPGASRSVAGPAIIETPFSTYVVPPDWELHLDKFGNGRLVRRQ